jgi:hypothetical protein
MKTMQNKSLGKKAGISLKGGGPSNVGHTQRTGPQAEGVTGVSKGASNSKFGVTPGGRGSMTQGSAGAAVAGQTGPGNYVYKNTNPKRRKGAGEDDAGNPL